MAFHRHSKPVSFTKCKVRCWGFLTDMQVFFIVCNEEVGVLCTCFIRRRNTCLYFSQRTFAAPSLAKNREDSAGVRAHPQPLCGGSGARPSRPAAHGPQPALRRPSLPGPARTIPGRFLPSFHGFPVAHPSASPFWVSCLHPAPKAQGSSNGKAQPALPRSCPVANLRKRQARELPGRSRRARSAVPDNARGASRDSWDTRESPRSRGTTSSTKPCAQGPRLHEPGGRRAYWGP